MLLRQTIRQAASMKKEKKLKSNKIFYHLVLCLSLLLLIAFNFPAYGSEKNTGSATAVTAPIESIDSPKSAEKKEPRIIVYYFHGTSRCATCKKIEKYTVEAINKAFEKELNAGTIQTKVINVEEKENTHFAEDYKLITKSVIVSETAGDNETRWKNLEKIWEYVLNEEDFKEYIIDEIKAYF